MRLLDAGAVGELAGQVGMVWSDLGLPSALEQAARLLSGAERARDVQAQAAKMGVFSSRRNVLVASPTNSGKTLIGYLLLCEALSRGQRAVLIEPLRALAQEKAEELEAAASGLGAALGVKVKVSLSTGDYRLEGETFADPAPRAELLITTPERLEAILRLPESQAWLDGVGAVCVDEAHMIGDSRRGGALEFLITSLLARSTSPRLALLSATIAVTDDVRNWLRPCDVVLHDRRTPPLSKWVAELTEDEDPTSCAAAWLEDALSDKDAQGLVFIHQARQAHAVAEKLTTILGPACGIAGALAYHSQMSIAQRQQVRRRFLDGECRVVVATSALAMGVNLPATHVVVRDLTYIGTRSPGSAELLQMAGRAGRGDCAGAALIVKRPHDRWATSELVDSLRLGLVPSLVSSFASAVRSASSASEPPSATVVTSLLSRSGERGLSEADLGSFCLASLAGAELKSQVPAALSWLERQRLLYTDPEDQRVRLTRLGAAVNRGVLPLALGGQFGAVMRDLLSLSEDDETLGRWTPLDFLTVLELLNDRGPSLRRFSLELSKIVNTWCEAHPKQVPMLFRRWLRGERGHSEAAEVLGSMGLEPRDPVPDRDEWARQRGYVAAFNAIVLYERANGRPVVDLERQFGVTNLAGIEERWRDTMMWLVAGLIHVLDVKTVFFHLKEECGADLGRIKAVKHHLGKMRHEAVDLLEQLKWASPLGAMLLSMRRRSGGSLGIGERSIRRLEDAGAVNAKQIASMSLETLGDLGLRPDIARRIQLQAKRMLV